MSHTPNKRSRQDRSPEAEYPSNGSQISSNSLEVVPDSQETPQVVIHSAVAARQVSDPFELQQYIQTAHIEQPVISLRHQPQDQRPLSLSPTTIRRRSTRIASQGSDIRTSLIIRQMQRSPSWASNHTFTGSSRSRSVSRELSMEEVQNPPDRNHSSNVVSILRPSDYDRDVARSSDLLLSDSGVRFLPEVDQEDQSPHSLSMQSQSDLAILLDITTPVQWTNHCQTLSFLVTDFHFDTQLLNNQPYTATTISQKNQFLYT